MKSTARLLIPVWGDVYVNKVLSITLPAVLAPGNLPALSEMFEVELVIITEARLFDLIRNSPSFQAAARLGSTRLLPLDDLFTDIHGDYGMVLTYALFRGFADLGARITETYLLPLNADFILSDGSLRHLGKLMLEGKRLIHAPSFRVNLEDVRPQLQARVDAASCTLRLPSREMVKLALANKHLTVRARTVNQRLFYQSYMDQFYWYVDEDTLIGYQWPVALVAIKPERAVSTPVIFWDFGFVPEAAPTAEPHFIGDSDDFFIMELQSRESGSEMIRLGWTSPGEIARVLTLYATKQHRECGKQLLTIHAADLPPDLNRVINESRAYMGEIYRRLAPKPVPHVNHPFLGGWFEETKDRQRGSKESAVGTSDPSDASAPASAVARPHRRTAAAVVLDALRAIYRRTFGSPPQVGRFHPLWIDMSPITSKIAAWRASGKQNILWMSSANSLLRRMADDQVDPAILVASDGRGAFVERAPYDACICLLSLHQLSKLKELYSKIRPLMKEGSQITFSIVRSSNLLEGGSELMKDPINFPAVDISEIRFFGTAVTSSLRAPYMRASFSFPTRPLARGFVVSAVLILLAPLARLANALAARRDATIFSPNWTSLLIEFTVKRRRISQAEIQANERRGADALVP